MATATLGDEGHALEQLRARLHAARSSATSPSHVLITLQPTARSAGPTKSPMKPKAIAPPNTPSTTSNIDRLPARLIRMGFTKLSTELMTAAPHTTMKIAQPTWSLE